MKWLWGPSGCLNFVELLLLLLFFLVCKFAPNDARSSPWSPWNAPVKIYNFLIGCPLPWRKCLGALPVSKTKHTVHVQACFRSSCPEILLKFPGKSRRWPTYRSLLCLCCLLGDLLLSQMVCQALRRNAWYCQATLFQANLWVCFLQRDLQEDFGYWSQPAHSFIVTWPSYIYMYMWFAALHGSIYIWFVGLQ